MLPKNACTFLSVQLWITEKYVTSEAELPFSDSFKMMLQKYFPAVKKWGFQKIPYQALSVQCSLGSICMGRRSLTGIQSVKKTRALATPIIWFSKKNCLHECKKLIDKLRILPIMHISPDRSWELSACVFAQCFLILSVQCEERRRANINGFSGVQMYSLFFSRGDRGRNDQRKEK